MDDDAFCTFKSSVYGYRFGFWIRPQQNVHRPFINKIVLLLLSFWLMYSSREQELLAYIQNLEAEIQKLKKQKKYGIVWEEKEENIDKNILPIVEEVETMRIEDSENKPYNLIIE